MAEKKESFLTRKVGPLPTWTYLAGIGVLGLYALKKRAAASGTSTGQAASGLLLAVIPGAQSTVSPTSGAPTSTSVSTATASGGTTATGTKKKKRQPTKGTKRNPAGFASQAPTSTINSGAYPLVNPNGSGLVELGTITGKGGQFTGYNVSGGAPVYAYQNGTWRQDFNVQTLPVGTPLATPSAFQSRVGNYTAKEKLGG